MVPTNGVLVGTKTFAPERFFMAWPLDYKLFHANINLPYFVQDIFSHLLHPPQSTMLHSQKISMILQG